MENLNFNHEIQFDEKQYTSIWGLKRRRLIGITCVALIGVFCLLSKYTLIIGILLLALSVFSVFAPKALKLGVKQNWDDLKYLHQKLIYSLDKDGMGVQGKTIDTKFRAPDIHDLSY